jgi:hypothetical protein
MLTEEIRSGGESSFPTNLAKDNWQVNGAEATVNGAWL